MNTHPNKKHIHHGRNIRRFRELLGIRQESLAINLGEDWTPQRVSQLEAEEIVDSAVLGQIAGIMKVPVAAFENMEDEGTIHIIANTFQDGSVANNSGYFNCTFTPFDKMIALYERLIRQQAEMIEKLERLMAQK